MNKYTVIGFYADSQEIFSHHVYAERSSAAYAVVSNGHADAVFTAVLEGHIMEGEGIEFPGSALVDAETVLSQEEVFGSALPTPFGEIDAQRLADWMAFARINAEVCGTPIGEDDSNTAAKRANVLYDEFFGVLPTERHAIQSFANKKVSELKSANFRFSGDTKTVSVRLTALTRQEYSEDVTVPVEFDDTLLDELTDKVYVELDGACFSNDPDYWVKGNCYHTEAI